MKSFSSELTDFKTSSFIMFYIFIFLCVLFPSISFTTMTSNNVIEPQFETYTGPSILDPVPRGHKHRAPWSKTKLPSVKNVPGPTLDPTPPPPRINLRVFLVCWI